MNTSPEIIRLFYEFWEATVPGREYILSADPPESLEKLPRSEAADVNRALRYLNRLGHLMAKGPLDAEFVSSLVGKDVIRTVTRIKPALEEARSRRSDPQYLEFIDYLFQICKQAYPDYEPRFHPEERRGLGLTI